MHNESVSVTISKLWMLKLHVIFYIHSFSSCSRGHKTMCLAWTLVQPSLNITFYWGKSAQRGHCPVLLCKQIDPQSVTAGVVLQSHIGTIAPFLTNSHAGAENFIPRSEQDTPCPSENWLPSATCSPGHHQSPMVKGIFQPGAAHSAQRRPVFLCWLTLLSRQ